MPLSWNLGTLTSCNPLGHSRPVTGLLFLRYNSFVYSLLGPTALWEPFACLITDVHSSLSTAFCRHVLTSISRKPFSTSSEHLHLDLPILPSDLLWNVFLTTLPGTILTTDSIHSKYFLLMPATVSKYSSFTINHLKTKRRQFYLRPSPYRAVHTFRLGYKNQSVYGVSDTSRCLFSDKYKKHKYSVGTAYSSWMLNVLLHHVTSRL